VTPEVTQPAAYSYLLGIYLGDGYISRTPKTYRLQVSRHERQTIVIERVGRAIMALRPGHSVGRRRRGAVVIVDAYANLWPQLFPQHGGRTQASATDRPRALAAEHRGAASD